jgi:hypothetical protein
MVYGFSSTLSWILGYGNVPADAAAAAASGNWIPSVSDVNYRTGFCQSILVTWKGTGKNPG